MIEVAVGSRSRAKLNAARSALTVCIKEPFSISGLAVPSGIAVQPMSDEETILGARNRAHKAAEMIPSARYALGMEGGTKIVGDRWFEVGWVCLYDTVKLEAGYGATPALLIPEQVRKLMEYDGLEESEAVAAVYGTDTIATRDCSGAISGGLFSAEQSYKVGVMAAFAGLRTQMPE